MGRRPKDPETQQRIEQAAADHLRELGFSLTEIASFTGMTVAELNTEVTRLISDGLATPETVKEKFYELFSKYYRTKQPSKARIPRNGAEYDGQLEISYLIDPYIPKRELTNIHGKSGCGKTFALALWCAATTTGKFPTETKEPGSVLYVSAEESFAEIADRIARAGGDLNRVQILDREASVGLNFDDGIDDFREIFKKNPSDLVVVDPWQAYCGNNIDANRQTLMRPFLQKIVLLANEFDFALVFVCHENKGQYHTAATDAISGSSEIANVARSCLKVIEDSDDPCVRHIVQTKSNHRQRGKSLKYRFVENRIVWDGFSPLTKESIEEASRTRRTPFEVLQQTETAAEEHRALIAALLEEARNTEICGKRLSYSEFRMQYGEGIFSGRQPKRVLTEILPEMQARNIVLKVDLDIRRGSKHHDRGFYIQKVSDEEPEE